jgi:plasmid stabilization system protein ParE
VTVSVRITPEAESQAREIHAWWRANRRSAPDLFLDELASAIELLAEAPLLGRPYRLSPVSGVRRLLLRATRYHLYYLVTNNEVAILAVWHGGRGARPPLRALD